MDAHDLEKVAVTPSSTPVESSSFDEALKPKSAIWRKILGWGVEENGIIPVPIEKRTDKRVFNLFTIWFTALLCLLPIPTGMLGTLAYGLSLRDSSLVIIFFTLLTTIVPAYMGTLGPKTGMRQMIQARYAFGFFGVSIILLLNAATITGFTVIAAIVGGQTLAAVSDSTISVNVGIVITCIIALVVSFSGYKVLHIYERYSWIPVFVAILVLVGCGGKHLTHQTVPEAPATAQSVLSFASLIAGFMIPFGGTVSDFGIYIDPSASRLKVFTYIYTGMAIPSVLLLILGAAIGGAIPNVPEWDAANLANSVGGVVTAMLSPAGGFGKFVAVILALSVIGNIAISMYSIALNMQMFLPILTRAPRAAFSIITTAVLIPVSIEAAHSFFASLENFLGIISYWSASYVAIMIVEFAFIRKGDYMSYDHTIWRDWRMLPTGIASLGAGICSFGLIVPCMSQLWYEGPIAKSTGDIGFEVAFCLTAIFGLPLPPGPPAEPFFGHFRSVPLVNPEFSYIEWGKEYSSDVLYFNILGRPVVVLNSVKAAVDLLSKKGSNYQDRPRFVLFEVMGWGMTLTFLRSGPKFQLHRKIIQSNFTKSAIVQYRTLQEREARIAVHSIMQDPTNWEASTRRFSSAIVLSIGFGITIDSNDHPYLKLTEDANFATTNGGSPASTIVDYFPIFKYAPNWLARSRPLKHARDWKHAILNLHEIPFANLQKEIKEGIAQNCIAQTLLEESAAREEKGEVNNLSTEDIKGACGAIFIAGANTTWSTIIICILNLLMNPVVLKKAQAEIDAVVGSNRLPNFEDRERLRYIDFIVQEAFRWAPLSPLGVPHRSIEDDTYNGMFIPAGTTIYANARAMCYDETMYKNPSKFNPDRFTPREEGGEGEPFAQGPFGFGRRICPGSHLAAASVWMILTTILRTMDILPAVDKDGKEIYPVPALSNGLSSHPEHFEVQLKPRSKQAEELLANWI
ncbi:hypothetical protein V501_02223 [Pseudogymnoascus sp. VKM F-4519 (FW-2642)]|nr:hypothetical protein V501_02223 [Pseudogymnoascus sp. VKM F-4519 (FW-2642)]